MENRNNPRQRYGSLRGNNQENRKWYYSSPSLYDRSERLEMRNNSPYSRFEEEPYINRLYATRFYGASGKRDYNLYPYTTREGETGYATPAGQGPLHPFMGRDHRGKGPKNYRRSDTRILDDLYERLNDDPFIDAREINCAVNQGDVVLSGEVSNRWDKRRAEDLADGISGVTNVENRLRIGHHDTRRTAQPDPEFQGNETTQLESFRQEIKQR